MRKKVISLLVIFTVAILFSSCTREERIDFSELLVRMDSLFDEVDFPQEAAFFFESKWYLFFSVFSENDCLLSAEQDENGFLTNVSVCAFYDGRENAQESFVSVCEKLSKCFVPVDYPTDDLLEEIGLYEKDSVFPDGAHFSQSGRYAFSLFGTDFGSAFYIELQY